MAQSYTLQQSGGDYDNMDAALDAVTQTNSTITISGPWTTADTSTDMNIDGGDGLTITATGDSATNGIAESHANGKSNAYRLRAAPGTPPGLFSVANTVTLEGFEIGNTSTGTSKEIFRIDADNKTLTCKKMLMYFDTRNSQQDIVYCNDRPVTNISWENCIIINARRVPIYFYEDESYTADINCCTFYNNGDNETGTAGIAFFDTNNASHTGTINIQNTISIIGNTGAYDVSFDTTATNTINIDSVICRTTPASNFAVFDDTTNGSGTISANISAVEGTASSGEVGFTDITGDADQMDLTPTAGANNEALDFGGTTPGNTGTNSGLLMPLDDIAGNTRNTTTVDCGAIAVNLAAAGARPQGVFSHVFTGPFGGPI